MGVPNPPGEHRRGGLYERYTKAKAIVALVGGIVGPALLLLQASISDDTITENEWIKVGIALVTGLATAGVVQRVPNRRIPSTAERADLEAQVPDPDVPTAGGIRDRRERDAGRDLP